MCLCRLVGERGSVRLVRRAYMYGGEPSKKKKRKHVMLDGGKRKGKQDEKEIKYKKESERIQPILEDVADNSQHAEHSPWPCSAPRAPNHVATFAI